MPELPEVESLRRGLLSRIRGQRILGVEVRKPKLVSGKGNLRTASPKKAAEFIRGLTGAVIRDIDRRAKNLIFRLSGGKVVLVHLKMSGQFVYREPGKKTLEGGHPIELSETVLPNKHTHVIFRLGKGTLYYNDTRMFGYLLYYPDEKAFEAAEHFKKIGTDPLDADFTPAYLRSALARKKGRLKSVLLSQEVVTGLGNIYADEACFEARIRPDRPAHSLRPAEMNKLYRAIRRILGRAIELGGSSVASYRLADGSRGNYAREHKVYGKSGGKCPNCGRDLRKTAINNRSTVFCPNCQK